MPLIPPLSYAASSVASDYAKRWADQKVWDRIMAGPAGRFLNSLTPRGQKFAEPLMYAISALMKWHVGDSTSVRQFITEVAGDAAPELAKRMLNDHTPPSAAVVPMVPEKRRVVQSVTQGIEAFTSFIAPWHGRNKE